jgi:hypothetical protein
MATAPDIQMATKRNDVPAKIDAEVLAVCRIAAAYKGLSLAEYLSESMRVTATRDVEESHAGFAKPKASGKPKGGK